MKNSTLLLLVILFFAPLLSLGQEFSLSGELRPRYESRNGYKTLPATDAEKACFVS